MEVGLFGLGIAFRPAIGAFGIFKRGGAGGVFCKVKAHKARPSLGLGNQGVQIKLAVRIVGNYAVRHALVADQAGQGAGVDPGNADHAARFHPGV